MTVMASGTALAVQVCLIISDTGHHGALTASVAPACCCVHMQLSEGDIIEELERMCNPTVYEGIWITHYDMVENGDKIDIVDKGQVCPALLYTTGFIKRLLPKTCSASSSTLASSLTRWVMQLLR